MEIFIALETYDDLFSDFDIRGYGERAFSKDFLEELRLRFRKFGTMSGVDIVLLVPALRRDPGHETLIQGRMSAFFAERCAHYIKEDKKIKRNSFLSVFTGLALLFGATFLVENFRIFPMLKDFLLVPAWFFVWNGLDLFIKERREMGKKRDYYGTLSSCGTRFGTIEDFREKGGIAR